MPDGRGLEIGLLGEFTASHDGTPLDLGGPRQRAVLAMLVIDRGRLVSAEQLIDNLWHDDRPVNAFAGLQSYVSHLRRRLEPDVAARARSGVISRQAHGYAVRLAPDAVDAWRFETLLTDETGEPVQRLTAALGLWRGAPLADYADRAWAQPEITRLEELRSLARERLAQARVDRGEAAVMVGELEVMVTEAPLREERWRLLALALYRANRQADALTALRRARSTFADELGVDPGPALRALESDILAQAPSLDAPPAAPTVFVPTAAPAPRAEAVADLVERDGEIAQLRRTLAELSIGQSTRLLIEGPAGIGKTRLLDELGKQAAERGVRVLIARGSPLERSFGYGVVRQLLEPAITDDMLCAAAAPARAVFDLATEHGEGSLAVLHALYAVTAQLAADRPLLIGVDNLQWADGPSLRYLAYIARRMSGMPGIIAATMRTGEVHEINDLVAELAWDTDTVLLRPQPLTEAATADLVARAYGQRAAPLFVAACHRTTCGNPLLVRQLLQALVTADVKPDASHAQAVLAVGSRAVSSQVLLRLRRMPEQCRVVARSVAVLGEAAQLAHVAALAGLAEAETAAAVATLARAEVLRDERTLGFVHPIVAEAVYRDVPSVERELQHERAAALLDEHGASAEQIAAHLMLAPTRGDARSVVVLRAAAGRAADRGAIDSAVAYLRRALEEPPQADVRPFVLLELGLQEALVDGRAGAERLRAAYERVGDSETQARIATAIAHTQVFASERGAAVTFARDAVRRLPEGMDDAHDALTALLRIGGLMQAVDPTLWRDDIAEPTGTGVGAQMLRATLAWEAMLEGADRERAVRLAREATSDDRLWHGDTGLLWCIAAATRMYADDDLGDFWLHTRTAAHARGSLFAVLAVNQWEGVWRWRRGELAEAKALISEAQEQDRMWGGSGVGLAYSYGALVGIDLDRGDVSGARALLDAAPPDALHGDGGRLLRLVSGGVLVREERFAEALGALDEIADPVGNVNPAFHPWRRVRAGALAGLGRMDEAVALVEEEVARLRRWGAPSALGLSLTDLGRVTGRREHFVESVALLETTDAAYVLCRARLGLAEHPDTPPAEAAALLREVIDSAVACDAHGVAKQACVALRRLGVEAPDEPARSPGPSATHHRVAALAARGLDVTEIAQALFLTPQTVETALGELAVR